MARSEIDLIILHPTTANFVENAEVEIDVRGGSAATVYSGETGGTTETQPLLTDEQGRVEGWLPRGRYTATITVSGFPVATEYFDIATAEDGSVDEDWIGASAVTTDKIAAEAVTTAKIDDDAVTAAKIGDDAVGSAQISTGAVGSTELAADAVTATQLRDDTTTDSNRAVTTDHIRNVAVTTGKIADSAVTSAKIADGTIATADIAASAVTSAKQTHTIAQSYQSGSMDGTSSTAYVPNVFCDITDGAGWYLVMGEVGVAIDSSETYGALTFQIATSPVTQNAPKTGVGPFRTPRASSPSGTAEGFAPFSVLVQTAGNFRVGINYTGGHIGGTGAIAKDGWIAVVKVAT